MPHASRKILSGAGDELEYRLGPFQVVVFCHRDWAILETYFEPLVRAIRFLNKRIVMLGECGG